MEDFVTYELAVKLKEKGFDYETRAVYERNIFVCRYEDVPKPTIAQVLKWLIEEKGLYICISLGEFSDWMYEISLIDGNIFCAVCEFNIHNKAKCVIFPKGKTTWEGFIPPCKFKDGDIVATTTGNWIGITAGGKKNHFIPTYCVIKSDGEFEAYFGRKEKWQFNKLATEEEKQKLFDAIKDNGYKWNAETKTLEKLIKPKFKVGDRIRHKEKPRWACTIARIEDRYYVDGHPMCYTLLFEKQNEYELIPNKFDITTLKPFDEVLVRDSNEREWRISLFSHCNELGYKYSCINGFMYAQCIPYENNEHLLGTTDNCDEFYKNWK